MNAANRFPPVSIGMPVYNGEKYIQEALDSLLAQDFGDFDLLISDNASTDRTQEICLDYAARDRRVRYQRNGRNIGAADNFNRVLEQARGKYFMWVAHDDLWDSQFLTKCVGFLDTNPTAMLVYPDNRMLERDSGQVTMASTSVATTGIGSPVSRVRLYLKGLVPVVSIYGLHRTKMLKLAMPMPKVLGPDHVVLLTLVCLGEFGRIDEPLFTYRTRQAQGSTRPRDYGGEYQKLIDPECARPAKYRSRWPTASVMCRRVIALNISSWAKTLVCLEILRWCVYSEAVDSRAYDRLVYQTSEFRHRFRPRRSGSEGSTPVPSAGDSK